MEVVFQRQTQETTGADLRTRNTGRAYCYLREKTVCNSNSIDREVLLRRVLLVTRDYRDALQ